MTARGTAVAALEPLRGEGDDRAGAIGIEEGMSKKEKKKKCFYSSKTSTTRTTIFFLFEINLKVIRFLKKMQLSSALSSRPPAFRCAPQGRPNARAPAAAASIVAPARRRRASIPIAKSAGDDATGAWLDLASFVSGSKPKSGGPYEELADAIGKAAYIDVNGWHLYVSDVKVSGTPLSTILAGELGPRVAQQQGRADSASVDALLKRVPIKMGGGKATVSLFDAVPSFALGDLHRAVEDWARNGGR